MQLIKMPIYKNVARLLIYFALTSIFYSFHMAEGFEQNTPPLRKNVELILKSIHHQNQLEGKKVTAFYIYERNSKKSCSLSNTLTDIIQDVLHSVREYVKFTILTRDEIDIIEQETLIKAGGGIDSEDTSYDPISLLGSADVIISATYQNFNNNSFNVALKAIKIEENGAKQLAFKKVLLKKNGLSNEDLKCLTSTGKSNDSTDISAKFTFLNDNNLRLESGARVTKGERYHILLEVTQTSWVYTFGIDGSSILSPIFPHYKIIYSNPLKPGKTYQLPGSGQQYRFDDTKGEETFYTLISNKPLDRLEKLLTLASKEKVTITKKELFGKHMVQSLDYSVSEARKELHKYGRGIIIENIDTNNNKANNVFEHLESDTGLIIRKLEFDHY